jgi:hypothetical protein
MSGPAECAGSASLFAIMIVLRIVNIIGYRFDADESQHLHVIWGWAHGLVQYRDLFDNHMPLFQIMLAPIFGLIGDRASDLCWMRFALLPMYFVAAWCIYRIGTLLFSRRVGVWAVILAGSCSTEPLIRAPGFLNQGGTPLCRNRLQKRWCCSGRRPWTGILRLSKKVAYILAARN